MIRTKHLVVSTFGMTVLMGASFVSSLDFGTSYSLPFTTTKVAFIEPQGSYGVEMVQTYRDTLERNRFIERVKATLPANVLTGTSESEVQEETPISDSDNENLNPSVIEENIPGASDSVYTTPNVVTPAPFPIATYTTTTTASATSSQEFDSDKEVALTSSSSSTESYGNTGF